MATQIHQIEDVFLETAAAEPWAGIEELRSNPTIGADCPGHLSHIGATGSQNAAIELIELILCARNAFAASLESSLLHRLVRRIFAASTRWP